MKLIILILLLGGMVLTGLASQMTFVEDEGKGTLTVKDEKIAVLTYRFGDQLKDGIDPKQTRSCYIHPLYSLEGKVLTADFPQDHLHHHGISWTWPIVKTRGQHTQTWHPANLRQYFVRWHKRKAKDDGTAISVENAWKLDGQEVVAKEIVTLFVHPVVDEGRAIDVEIRIEAAGGPLTLQGTLDQNKGYGGFSLRGAPMFTGAAMTTDKGPLEKDSTTVPFLWADISTKEMGVAIFVAPDHVGFPTAWLIRNSYAGFLNVSWPGLKPATLQPGETATLRYRLYIHPGDATDGQVRRAYERYLSQKKRNNIIKKK
jgi:hypothetical protein